MLKIHSIFYNSDPYSRGLTAEANCSSFQTPTSWEKTKTSWNAALKKGDMSEVLFLVTQYDVTTGLLEVLENTYLSTPLKVKRVINKEAQGTQPINTGDDEPSPDESEDLDD